jgi:hypothetical protein
VTQPPRHPGQRSPYDDGQRQPPEQPMFTPSGPGPRGQAGPPQPPTGPPPAGQRPSGRHGRAAEGEENLPSWAGLGPDGQAPSRGDRTAARRKKRRLIIAAAAVVVVGGGLGGYFGFGGGSGPANVVSNDLITTFLPGELQQVPGACDAVPSATMTQYMPGPLKTVAPPLNSGLESQCTWTLDNAPTYRVLELDLHAYSPSGLASGDGSATFAAIDAYEQAQSDKQDPGKNSGEPDASITTITVDGDPAFVATQVYNDGSTLTDMATEVVRYHNVLITTIVDGVQDTSGGKRYGPVSMSDLTAEVQAIAQGATTKVMH